MPTDLLLEQDNSLQRFKLPEPVICMGGRLQVELLGRVQRQEMDDLYYIWLVHYNPVSLIIISSFVLNETFFVDLQRN